MNKTVIIQASSRSKGDSFKVSQQLLQSIKADYIDLNTITIEHYDYDYKNSQDDFLPLVEKIATQYEHIIFLTPIYWYTMSGILKVFFDRFSDLLRIHKDTGRKFRGKNVGLVSVNNTQQFLNNFAEPVDLSCQYLGMNFIKYIHVPVIDDDIPSSSQTELENFTKLFK